ncbi:glycoside hydrolase family 128 protein [Zopfia rhizophila CBS 207.26]|uniref:Glycoside hydrolase family 128 protein n=1 Tax=Zopfia rhizophila CBS 207.26 TaxID=1314779 RepID=A0A6A6EVZ5_9PEZI|nr:glycoside hydrolase family 128 protein [Zopfia rhizophila CBS 207.26]
MSLSIKLGLLTLVSTAAAVPHYGHSKFHSSKVAPSGGYGGPGTGSVKPPYPSGGWGGHNNSTRAGVTGTGGAPTTTILETAYSTATEVSTIYATRPKSGGGYGEGAPSSVGAVEIPTGGAGQCGPATVYVTATNKVTITVPAGGAPPSSAAEPASSAPVSAPGGGYGAPSSAAEPVPSAPASAPAGGYGAPSAAPSSVGEEKISIPYKQQSTPSQMSILPVTSAPAPSAPVSSAAPVSSKAVSSGSPKPSSSSTPSYSGGKRGLAYNDASLCSKLGGGKFSFAYNWASVENGQLPEGVKFVPMMHKPADATPEKWLENVDKAVKAGSNAVMGFNEPDHSSQANLSPEQACKDWTTYMEPVAKKYPDLTILGPSVTNGETAKMMGLDGWLKPFREACPGATYHATNIHFYDIYNDGVVDRFIKNIENAYENFGKKKVWVTEFGLNPGSANAEQAADFLKKVMEYMDGSDKVQGYAYFMVGSGENQLLSGQSLSPAGNVYASA